MTDRPKAHPADAKPDTPDEPAPAGLLETVHDPEPIEDAKDLDDKGEPGGDNFA